MKHWLISYAYRRHGREETDFCNAVHKGSLVQWFKETMEYSDGDYTLIQAIPIDADEYKWCKENIG